MKPATVTIYIDNVWCYIEEALDPVLQKYLDGLFSFYVPGHKYMQLFRQHRWDGKKHFYQCRNQKFPTGFLQEILKQFADPRRFAVVFKDVRKHTRLKKVISSEDWATFLQDKLGKTPSLQVCAHQRNAVLAVKKHQMDGLVFRRGMICMGTGIGKTWSAAIFPLLAPTANVLYVINIKELAYQTQEIWESILKEKVGLIGDKVWKQERVTIALIQSLTPKRNNVKMKAFLRKQNIFIADEAHGAHTRSISAICDLIGADIRVGYSGTILTQQLNPFRLTDATLIANFGPKIYDLPAAQLREEGLLANIEVVSFPAQISSPGETYLTEYKEGIVHNAQRNDDISRLIQQQILEKRQTLVICSHVKHCWLLFDLLKYSGSQDECVILTGKESSFYRNKMRAEFKAGNIRVIIASTIFDKGVDLPEISSLILAAGGRGGPDGFLILQRIGRAMRKKATTENVARVFDFKDTGGRFMEKVSKTRFEIFQEEGFTQRHYESVQDFLQAECV